MRTVFLVALASGKRRGELHAFIIDGSGVTDSRSACVLCFDRQFLSKTTRLGHRSQDALTLPALLYQEQEER